MNRHEYPFTDGKKTRSTGIPGPFLRLMSATPNLALQGEDFYRYALGVLDTAGIDYLLGGAFATGTYTGVVRDTKDLDCMIRQSDVEATLDVFRRLGIRAEIAFPHWLAKVYHGDYFIDFIYCAG